MDTRTGKLRPSCKRHLPRAVILSLLVGTVLAAALFVANSQPWGYVAPPALSGANIKSGNVVAYTPWFETGSFRGDLLAFPIASSGAVNLLAPMWRAASVLDGQHYQTGRRIVTTDGLGGGIPFQFVDLTPAQQLLVGSASILDYVRGDRSNESPTGLRERSSVLGDIIHSGPVYVGKPAAGYNFDAYLAFSIANAGRAPRVYVGANDGMLHAFDATDGSEVYAYVPSMVMENLPELAVQPYDHRYFVDGFLNVQDVQFAGSWHSVLVGGLGAGGRGYYALDVTSAAAATEAAAASKILWEFHSGSAGAANLGFSYSRPSIVRLNNGEWAAVVANGYLSTTGYASLYLLDVQTGAVIREIAVPDFDANGLSSPTLIDTDGDGYVDVAYAGDLNGNLWKFDLSSASPAAWSVAWGGQPLFQTALNGSVRQAITTAPEVGRHPAGGVMVYVGTGRLLSLADGTDKTTQNVYGIWDNNWAAGEVPISMALLRTQQLKSATHVSGAAVRAATANYPDYLGGHRGWMTPTEIAGAAALDQGERVIQDLLLRDGRIQFMSVNPTLPTGDNWYIQLDAMTGGAPKKTIIDVNSDSGLDVLDNVDGNGDGMITDIPEDRVVGEYQSFGLVSRPVIGILGAYSDSALINHLVAISPTDVDLPYDPDDPGLLGGHFDLDTSHLIYPINTGPPSCNKNGLPPGCVLGGPTTDGHVHQWDDIHNLTTINYFNLPDGSGNPLYEITSGLYGVKPSDVFILTVANDDLSPGGVLEINGASMSVVDYRALLDRYLSGTLGPGETFPLYKRQTPTASEAADGVVQLTSLKLSFDAFAILSGDLVPTNTGCVRSNNPGALGEYRNGALMIQALEIEEDKIGEDFEFKEEEDKEDEDDEEDEEYKPPLYKLGDAKIHGTLGYAIDGLLWESTVFWHWDGPCYGESTWAQVYDECITQGLGGCTKGTKEQEEKGKKKKKKKKKKKDDEDDENDEDDEDDEDEPPPPPPGGESDPSHTLTNTTIGGDNSAGRLFWKEIVPEE